ncbi:helicase conserved C-terminal domain [Longilinea arvoryzae]|uniref:Helicase conserved C-terminal domain n=1 Tax=Longilinea arvoryzae TaxID=360412 RepID=A0A0S7B8F6_9CHLR|nr:helicase-associated domain-containing protein [Longilinea arvoryzae]GAP13804.1 helicase conserved C-terminal domain [Longilinea arvoryzae]
MPDLQHLLQGHDLGFLKMVAAAWGIELNAPDAYTALPQLVQMLLDRPRIAELLDILPAEARAALDELLENDGRLSWAIFSRRFGEVRGMGSARRDRERPDLKPASPAEVLWYRALIGRAFFNDPPEPLEYAYIPDDLLELIQPSIAHMPAPLGRKATAAERAHPQPVNDHILDHACTLLAGLRLGLDPATLASPDWDIPPRILIRLLQAAGLLDSKNQPHAEAVKTFLGASRGQGLATLTSTWMGSPVFNELRLLPGLSMEGEWSNDPLLTRRLVLDLISAIPQDTWWSLSAFVNAVRERHPDYQRPAGDYDSWFIRQESDGEFLRGFAAWDQVDGALLRFLICGPLHWLGLLELAAPAPGGEPSAFRFSPWAAALWHGSSPEDLPAEDGGLRVISDGRVTALPLAPRALRYQIARFCAWEGERNGEYRYHITPASLERARQQGLKPAQLMSLLRRYAPVVPPPLAQAIDRWESQGVQASIRPAVLLRVASPDILAALRKSRAARFLAEPLSPTAVLIHAGSEEKVLLALAELGYLGEIQSTE